MTSVILFLLLIQSSALSDQPTSSDEPAIVVTGTPEQREEVAPSGSRIARPQEEQGYRQIASDTGVAGLVPGSGMDPFAGQTRTVRVTECRAQDVTLSGATVCLFGSLQQAFAAGEFGTARARLDGIAQRPDLTDEERYLTHWYAYGIAIADGGDDLDRQAALEGMVATTAMPESYRLPALRTLVSIALRKGERQKASTLLEQVVGLAPTDAHSRGNLAALYSEQGRDEEAAGLLREAIALRRESGAEVPHAWAAFVEARGQ